MAEGMRIGVIISETKIKMCNALPCGYYKITLYSIPLSSTVKMI